MTVRDLGILGKIIEFVTSGILVIVSVVIDTAGPSCGIFMGVETRRGEGEVFEEV